MADLYIRAYCLVGFVELAQSHGGDAMSLLKEAGLADSVLNDPDSLIPWDKTSFLLELAAEKLNRPSLGLEWALNVPDQFPNLGPTILIAQFVENGREWVAAVMRYWRNHTNAFVLHLFDDGVSEHIVYRYEFDAAMLPSRQQVEYYLGTATRLSRVVGAAPDENPVLVRFKHSRPADTSLHDRLFRCPIEFDAPHNEFVLERRLLDFQIHGSLKNFKWLLDRYIRSRIRRLPVYDQSMTTMVTSAVRGILGSRLCSAEFVAGSLGMSNKKMQRLLAREGASFSQILDEVRRAAAIEMLSQSDAPVSRIAGLLDYSTVAPFTTAFTRWTGVSPRAYRNQAKSGFDSKSLES